MQSANVSTASSDSGLHRRATTASAIGAAAGKLARAGSAVLSRASRCGGLLCTGNQSLSCTDAALHGRQWPLHGAEVTTLAPDRSRSALCERISRRRGQVSAVCGADPACELALSQAEFDRGTVAASDNGGQSSRWPELPSDCDSAALAMAFAIHHAGRTCLSRRGRNSADGGRPAVLGCAPYCSDAGRSTISTTTEICSTGARCRGQSTVQPKLALGSHCVLRSRLSSDFYNSAAIFSRRAAYCLYVGSSVRRIFYYRRECRLVG